MLRSSQRFDTEIGLGRERSHRRSLVGAMRGIETRSQGTARRIVDGEHESRWRSLVRGHRRSKVASRKHQQNHAC
jgi:hypothetical protein